MPDIFSLAALKRGGGGGSVDEATIRAAFGASETTPVTIVDDDMTFVYSEENEDYEAITDYDASNIEGNFIAVEFTFDGYIQKAFGAYSNGSATLEDENGDHVGYAYASENDKVVISNFDEPSHVKMTWSTLTPIDKKWTFDFGGGK